MSILLARRGTIAKGQSGAAAAPYNLAWAHVLWAGDPDWANPGDGNPVDSWRNDTGGGDPAMTGGNRPTYRAATATFNNKPTVQFVSGSSQRLDVDIADLAQPFSLVVVGNVSGGAAEERLVGQGGNAAGGVGSSGTNFVGATNATLTGGADNASPHLFRFYANGNTLSELSLDGAAPTVGNGGTGTLGRLTVGAASTSVPAFSRHLTGHVAFFGAIAGDVAVDAGWAAFKAWVAAEYGLVIV